MKFLLDMNLPRSLAERLASEGHECDHAGDLELSEEPDARIVEHARATGAVILTHDLDYGQILAFSGERRPSVVIFRGVAGDAEALFRVLSRHEATWSAALEPGAIIVIEADTVRVRPLPVQR